jgi:hypothetical protein
LLGSGFQWRTFPFLWVPELSPTSATSFSQLQLSTDLNNHWGREREREREREERERGR